MNEKENEKRLVLVRAILDLSDEEILSAFIGTTNDPDATTKSHGGTGHPNEPPPGTGGG